MREVVQAVKGPDYAKLILGGVKAYREVKQERRDQADRDQKVNLEKAKFDQTLAGIPDDQKEQFFKDNLAYASGYMKEHITNALNMWNKKNSEMSKNSSILFHPNSGSLSPSQGSPRAGQGFNQHQALMGLG